MKLILLTIHILLLQICLSQEINHFFQKINYDVIQHNRIAAEIAWESSINPGNPELPNKAANYQRNRIKWQDNVCAKLVALNNDQMLNDTQRRQTYLLCRGPKFTFDEAREMSSLYEEIQSLYTEAEICIDTTEVLLKSNLSAVEDAILSYLTVVKESNVIPLSEDIILTAAKIPNFTECKKDNVLCLNGEEDMEKMMKFSRNEEVLRWLWTVWREKVGPPMKRPYKKLVEIQNMAARRNGYTDIGAAWRDDMEVSNLRQLCRRLYKEVRPLYAMLHGVVRFYLRKHYGDIVPEYGPIPAHVIGNLWSQNWESLADLIIPQTIDLDESIKNLNWTVEHMLKRAEDFYQSLGLPPMTDTFWRESVFTRENGKTRCHGTAADMFQDGDYRLLYCSDTSVEDFYVIHHEMGHIQYYMAYKNQPGIFRQANPALHETIGDTIMYGVMTPQHLHRLGLVNDTVLYTQPGDVDDGDDDVKDALDYLRDRIDVENKEGAHQPVDFNKITPNDILLLKMALNKIPQIPFSLLIDEYRWKYFEGRLGEHNVNGEFWRMALDLQGIAPPGVRDEEESFDAGAKFHVPDNTPYIRYFLSSFLQHQLYEKLCKAAVFGHRDVTEDLPLTIALNRCDIYGSKAAGKLLKDFMSRGHSQSWREILAATIREDHISASALKRYYRPLYKLLKRIIRANRIPIGW